MGRYLVIPRGIGMVTLFAGTVTLAACGLFVVAATINALVDTAKERTSEATTSDIGSDF